MKKLFLLHGLGSHAFTLYPLQWWLSRDFDNSICIEYPVDEFDSVADMVSYVDQEMLRHADKKLDTVTLIGQSMGGVVANNMHTKGWRIDKAVYIGSPLHGARLLNQLEAVLPTRVKDLLKKKSYEVLQAKPSEVVPPHPYATLSMGWACSRFDGCVYQDEAILEPEHHTHLSWADHRTVFANPRLWMQVRELLTSH